MPELSRFYGIIIRMYFSDHPPPHFHAKYGEHEAVISISDLSILAGSLPGRALGLVVEWATLHQDELRQSWNRAETDEDPGRIDPLP